MSKKQIAGQIILIVSIIFYYYSDYGNVWNKIILYGGMSLGVILLLNLKNQRLQIPLKIRRICIPVIVMCSLEGIYALFFTEFAKLIKLGIGSFCILIILILVLCLQRISKRNKVIDKQSDKNQDV